MIASTIAVRPSTRWTQNSLIVMKPFNGLLAVLRVNPQIPAANIRMNAQVAKMFLLLYFVPFCHRPTGKSVKYFTHLLPGLL
jgi:hypothetical protein